jgi:hypothetical protein
MPLKKGAGFFRLFVLNINSYRTRPYGSTININCEKGIGNGQWAIGNKEKSSYSLPIAYSPLPALPLLSNLALPNVGAGSPGFV